MCAKVHWSQLTVSLLLTPRIQSPQPANKALHDSAWQPISGSAQPWYHSLSQRNPHLISGEAFVRLHNSRYQSNWVIISAGETSGDKFEGNGKKKSGTAHWACLALHNIDLWPIEWYHWKILFFAAPSEIFSKLIKNRFAQCEHVWAPFNYPPKSLTWGQSLREILKLKDIPKS